MPAMDALREARELMGVDRARGLRAFAELFRAGQPPDPLPNGRYGGEFVAFDLEPGVTRLAELISARWRPWRGKLFDAASGRGYNIVSRDSLALTRLLWPFYRGYWDDGPLTLGAFAFRTCLASGLADPDRRVLRIDYDLAGNPQLVVRQTLDELVQLEEGHYLGRAYLTAWPGRWKVVAYFALGRDREV